MVSTDKDSDVREVNGLWKEGGVGSNRFSPWRRIGRERVWELRQGLCGADWLGLRKVLPGGLGLGLRDDAPGFLRG